jgi:hypothetical protein
MAGGSGHVHRAATPATRIYQARAGRRTPIKLLLVAPALLAGVALLVCRLSARQAARWDVR